MDLRKFPCEFEQLSPRRQETSSLLCFSTAVKFLTRIMTENGQNLVILGNHFVCTIFALCQAVGTTLEIVACKL